MTQEFQGDVNNGQFAGRDINNHYLLSTDSIKNNRVSELKNELIKLRKCRNKARRIRILNIWVLFLIAAFGYLYHAYLSKIIDYIIQNLTLTTSHIVLKNIEFYVIAVVKNSPLLASAYGFFIFICLYFVLKIFADEGRYIQKNLRNTIAIEDELRNRRA